MPSFPKRLKTSQTAELGVNQVSSIINDTFGWMFRRVPGETDFGIDGHADIVLDDGSVTGRSLAFQIKSGESFLKRKNEVGFVYRGDVKHLNYYANHSTPVIIVLCDTNKQKCYWEEFDLDRTDGTGLSWTMTIPFSQQLNLSAKTRLATIAGPIEDLSAALRQQWAMNELLKDMAHVHYAVSRIDVEAMNTSNITSFFSRLEKNVGVCKAVQGKVTVSFSGYDNDPRELWEISEVRHWFKKVFAEVKYWFYFLDPLSPDKPLSLLLALLCDTKWKVKGSQADMDAKMMAASIEQCFSWLNQLTDHLGMPMRENKKISLAVIAAIQNNFVK